MIDACELLLKENEALSQQAEKEKFGFKFIAKKIIKRQAQGKDTIIVVVGDRRNGKSNFMLKIILAFIMLKKETDKDFKWKWKKNFPLTRTQAVILAEEVEDKSFISYDEMADIAYRSDTLSTMNKNLIKFMNKSGKKCLLTIMVLPDLYQLDPKILNMAHMLVVVPYRFEDICSFYFIYGRINNPLVTDKFGLERVKRKFQSRRTSQSVLMSSMDGKMIISSGGKKVEVRYPRHLFKFLRSMPNFAHWGHFQPVLKTFEESYIKNVKDNQLMAHEVEETFVNMKKYKKTLGRYEALLYNVYMKGGRTVDGSAGKMTYTQLANLHQDSKGHFLIDQALLSRLIQRIRLTYDAPRNN